MKLIDILLRTEDKQIIVLEDFMTHKIGKKTTSGVLYVTGKYNDYTVEFITIRNNVLIIQLTNLP